MILTTTGEHCAFRPGMNLVSSYSRLVVSQTEFLRFGQWLPGVGQRVFTGHEREFKRGTRRTRKEAEKEGRGEGEKGEIEPPTRSVGGRLE